MKLHLPSSLRAALLACLVFAPSLHATSYIADGVNVSSLKNSTRFYDSGKGCYWVWYGEPPRSGATELLTQTGSYEFLGNLYERVPDDYKGEQSKYAEGAFANLRDDENTCWAYVSANLLQYWQTYYGVFSLRADQLPHGLNYSKDNLEKLGGTQSLEISMTIYDNWKNDGGNILWMAPWYLGNAVPASAQIPYPLYREDIQPAGYFQEYYNNSNDEFSYISYTSISGKEALGTFSDYLANSMGYYRYDAANNPDVYTKTEEGLIVYLGIKGVNDGGGHGITCYGFETDGRGNIIALKVTNSDDYTYELFTVYVKQTDEKYMLFADKACSQPWQYVGQGWYIIAMANIQTPQTLKTMLAEYSDTTKALYWNGGATEWGGKAGQFNADVLPTASTGWEAVAGTSTQYQNFYASYYDSARKVVFDDRAEGKTVNISLAADVSTEGMTVDNSKVDYSFNGNGRKLHATSLDKGGSMTLTFNNVKLEASTVNISGGWVELSGGSALTGDSVVLEALGGGLLFDNASATLTGNLTVGRGATLELASASSTTIATITCDTGSLLAMTVEDSNKTAAVLTQTGNLTVNGAITLTLNATQFSEDVTYTLASVSGTLQVADLTNVSISGTAYLGCGYTGELRMGADGKSLQLGFVEEGCLYWEAGSATWDKTQAKWSATDDKTSQLIAFSDAANVRFTNGSADINVAEAVQVGKMRVENGTYSFTNSSHINVSGGLQLRNQASVTLDRALTLAANATVAIEDAASNLTITEGDVSLASLSNAGTLTLKKGSLALTSAVAKGGTVDVSGSISLADNSANSFTKVTAGELLLGKSATLNVSETLATESITLAGLGAQAGISAGSLDAANLDVVLSADALSDLGALGLTSGNSVSLLSLGSAPTAALTVGSLDRVTLGGFDYIIGVEGTDVVLTAHALGMVQWTSADGEWDDTTDLGSRTYDSTSTVGLLGLGTSKVGVSGTVSVGKLLVDSDSKNYQITGAGTLQSGALEVKAGVLTVDNDRTEVAGAIEVGSGGTLEVIEGSELRAASMQLDGSFSNAGRTAIDGALIARGRVLVNTGSLKVGDGSQLGTVTGAGSIEISGGVTADALRGFSGLTVAQGASLLVSEDLSVQGSFHNEGSVRSLTKLSFAAPVSHGGHVAAPWIVLEGSGNSFTSLSASTLELRGHLGGRAASQALLEVDNLTMPNGSLTLLLADTSLAEGQYLLATVDGALDASSITLGAECKLAFMQNKLSPSLVCRDGSLYLELVSREALYAGASHTTNGRAGGSLLDAVFNSLDPQTNRTANPDLAAVMDALDVTIATGNSEAADQLAAAVSGASIATLGQAYLGDVSRQLRAIRNRTTTMGVDPCVVNEDMPYVNAWINAEGDYRKMDGEGTDPGYTLSSWGGTVGFDVDVNPTLTLGFACSALYGDLTASGADVAEGQLDSYYGTLFARYSEGGWVHTFVLTGGAADMSLDRTVRYSGGEYETSGSTTGSAWGALYEVAFTIPMDEEGRVCWQPVANISYIHSSVKGYTETGSDAAISAGEQEANLLSLGLGARMQAVVDESIYNRTSILELRALVRADFGDRKGDVDVAFAALPGSSQKVRTGEFGAFGVELGAGLTVPISSEAGELFFDVSAELRNGYSNVNGTVGYRLHF